MFLLIVSCIGCLMSSNGNFENIPAEIIEYLLSYLDPQSLASLLVVNLSFKSYAESEWLWKNLFKISFPHKFDRYERIKPNTYSWLVAFKNEYDCEYAPVPKAQRKLFFFAERGEIESLQKNRVTKEQLEAIKDKNGISLKQWAGRSNPDQLSELYKVKNEEDQVFLLKLLEDFNRLKGKVVKEPKPFKGILNLTPLMFVAKKGEIGLLHLLIAKGANVNERRSNFSALTEAVLSGHKAAVDLLLAKGALISTLKVTEKFIHYPATSKLKDGKNNIASIGLTAEDSELTIALHLNQIEIFKSLLNGTQQLPAQILHSALALAVGREELDWETIKQLTEKIEEGAVVNVNYQDEQGFSLLALALSTLKVPKELIQFLIDKGANIFEKETFLEAIDLGHEPEIIATLFSRANEEILKKAFDMATEKNNVKAVEIVLNEIQALNSVVEAHQTVLSNAPSEPKKVEKEKEKEKEENTLQPSSNLQPRFNRMDVLALRDYLKEVKKRPENDYFYYGLFAIFESWDLSFSAGRKRRAAEALEAFVSGLIDLQTLEQEHGGPLHQGRLGKIFERLVSPEVREQCSAIQELYSM